MSAHTNPANSLAMATRTLPTDTPRRVSAQNL